MKDATKDLSAYEYVFYTSEARSHELNHYQFEFPGTWRTKVGSDLILAVRGLHLKKCTRSFQLSSILNYYATDTAFLAYTFEFCYAFGSNSTIADMLIELNSQWRDQMNDMSYSEVSQTRAAYQLLLKDKVHWRLNLRENRVELTASQNTMNKLDDHLSFENHPDPDQSQIFHSEVLKYGHVLNPWPVSMGTPAFKTWNRQDLLLTADFITQAENQHLGYTDSEYSIFKEYEIKKNTPYFTISLWEDETKNPIELPADKKDYVVIETVISRKYEV
jgi:hypothetical protein